MASVIDKIIAASKALEKGRELKNPAEWKNKQMVMGGLLAILALIPTFTEIKITESELNAICYGLATIFGLLQPYFIAATSTKVGLPSKNSDK